jgi:hypothetical protein
VPTLDDILRGRHAILEDAPQTLADDIARVLAVLARSLDEVLAEIDRADGRIVRSEGSIRLAVNMLPSLVRALEEAGYGDAAAAFVDRYADVVDAVRATFEVERLPAPFTTVSVSAAEAARTLDLGMLDAIGEQAMREVQRSITQAVLYERDYSAFVEDLRGQITGTDVRGAPLATRANAYAGTAIAVFDATVTGMIADEAGVTHFRYWGPLDKVTRPWCKARLNDNRALTREQIEALPPSPSNTLGIGSFLGRGGMNCRHVWTPTEAPGGTE